MYRKLSQAHKKKIAANQFYKCNNKPNSKLKGLEGYKCPLWLKNDDNKGSFDFGGYEIDHIEEYSVTKDDSDDNLQALCKNCHSVKTKNFMMEIMKQDIKKNKVKEIQQDTKILGQTNRPTFYNKYIDLNEKREARLEGKKSWYHKNKEKVALQRKSKRSLDKQNSLPT